MLRTAGPKYLSQNGRVAGISDLVIDGISNVIEKGFEAGVTVAFCGLFGPLGKTGQKAQNIIGSN